MFWVGPNEANLLFFQQILVDGKGVVDGKGY